MLPSGTLCPFCGDWDYFQVPTAFWGVLPNQYPIKTCDCGECPLPLNGCPIPATGYLAPLQLTLPWLILALLFTIHNQMGGLWNKGETECFLKQCDLNSKIHGKLEFFKLQYTTTNIREGDSHSLANNACITEPRHPHRTLH